MSCVGREGWDWAWLLFLGTNILKMPEEQFWRSTPKKLQALFKVYVSVSGVEESKELESIDNIIF